MIPYSIEVVHLGFPVIHKAGKVGSFVQLLMETSWIWLKAEKIDANLHLSWCFEIKLMSLVTKSNLFSN